MEYAAFRAPPRKESVAQDKLNAFTFSFDPSVKLVEVLKYLHRQSGRSFIPRPLFVFWIPLIPV